MHKQFLLSNISGSPVIAAPLSGWSGSLYVDGVEQGTATVTFSEIENGWYNAYVADDLVGTNLLVPTYNANYSITPTAETWEKSTTYDTDDIYAKFLSSTGIKVSTTLSSYVFNLVANDDFYGDIGIDPISSAYGGNGVDISGWSFMFKSDSPAVSGAAAITDATNRLIRLSIPKEQVPTALLSGADSLAVYMDVQGTSPTLKKLTVARITMNVVKDYANG